MKNVFKTLGKLKQEFWFVANKDIYSIDKLEVRPHGKTSKTFLTLVSKQADKPLEIHVPNEMLSNWAIFIGWLSFEHQITPINKTKNHIKHEQSN